MIEHKKTKNTNSKLNGIEKSWKINFPYDIGFRWPVTSMPYFPAMRAYSMWVMPTPLFVLFNNIFLSMQKIISKIINN